MESDRDGSPEGTGETVTATGTFLERVPNRRDRRARSANECFHIDFALLDVPVEGDERSTHPPIRPWCAVAVDEYTRTVAGCVLSVVEPDDRLLARLLFQAVVEKENSAWANKGIPDLIRLDTGLCLSDEFDASCVDLAVSITLGHSTPLKSRAEWWFGMLDRDFVQPFRDGSTCKTVAVVTAEIHAWIAGVYHRRIDRDSGVPIGDLWQRSARTVRMPRSESLLREALFGKAESR